jgi:hypothetical protein
LGGEDIEGYRSITVWAKRRGVLGYDGELLFSWPRNVDMAGVNGGGSVTATGRRRTAGPRCSVRTRRREDARRQCG